MIVINGIEIKDDGKKVVFDYTISPELDKYFNKKDPFFVAFDIDVSNVPLSILYIPFLVNLLPISWFLKFKIQVDELDDKFMSCVDIIKSEFQKMYPEYELKGELSVKQSISNSKDEVGSQAMLFSGGVDAVSAYIRHEADDLSLFSIRGADIGLKDIARWEDLINYNNSQEYLKGNSKYNISSNLQTFYTYKLDQKLNIGWWGKVQHGMALLGVTAPVTYLINIDTLYIGSTHTKETQISWGSNPITDELLKWANTKIVHECYDLSRQEKIESITRLSKSNGKKIGLRVCYSERREDLNCSICEKCLRTIMGIILEGDDPNKYSFRVDSSFYSKVEIFLKSKINTLGIFNHWKTLQTKASKTNNFYVFENKKEERSKLKTFYEFEIDESGIKTRMNFIARWKFSLIKKYPNLFNFYLKYRLKLIK